MTTKVNLIARGMLWGRSLAMIDHARRALEGVDCGVLPGPVAQEVKTALNSICGAEQRAWAVYEAERTAPRSAKGGRRG